VFHVLLLKKSIADDAITSSFHSKMDDYGSVKFQLLVILDRKIIKKKQGYYNGTSPVVTPLQRICHFKRIGGFIQSIS
jgi:hypothetical protein